jgi:L-ascorbate metabolism protein UlaG (beta-lactamase superfamily)
LVDKIGINQLRKHFLVGALYPNRRGAQMNIQQIRNATMRFEYAQRKFLTDPYLAPLHTLPSYTGLSPNPMVELPCTSQEVIADIEMVVVSHLHSDHYDSTAQELLPKDLPVFCQPGDEQTIQSHGFRSVTPVTDSRNWNGIKITKITGQHGSGETLEKMGKASGFVFKAENEPTIYWAGDTIWCDHVAEAIDQYQPDIIITHSCGAVWDENVLIVMDAAHTVEVCQAAPNSIVIATHMEALDHATVTRQELRAYTEASGISPEQLLIPVDGEILFF